MSTQIAIACVAGGLVGARRQNSKVEHVVSTVYCNVVESRNTSKISDTRLTCEVEKNLADGYQANYAFAWLCAGGASSEAWNLVYVIAHLRNLAERD